MPFFVSKQHLEDLRSAAAGGAELLVRVQALEIDNGVLREDLAQERAGKGESKRIQQHLATIATLRQEKKQLEQQAEENRKLNVAANRAFDELLDRAARLQAERDTLEAAQVAIRAEGEKALQTVVAAKEERERILIAEIRALRNAAAAKAR